MPGWIIQLAIAFAPVIGQLINKMWPDRMTKNSPQFKHKAKILQKLNDFPTHMDIVQAGKKEE